MGNPILEPAAQELVEAIANATSPTPPSLEDVRKGLDDLQAAPVEKPDVQEKWITVPAEVGDVQVRIVKPVGANGLVPVVVFMHGGGWVLGDAHTYDRFVRELAVGADAAVAFVEYDRSPEARYPVAIEQGYAVARWIMAKGVDENLDATRMAVAGDSAGGNMTAALTIMAKQRGDVSFVHQSLYCPVTDAAQDTRSYREFAAGPFLSAEQMAWFWDCYTPDPAERAEITASPLLAELDDLAGLPPALVIVDENDVLRDEGEAYARKLTQAGVPTISVRYNGTLHDFMVLNRLRSTQAATAAMHQATQTMRAALHAG
ncbi:alpha/beta hydrolase [Streptomyces cadmiisoli]|uniref:alpha/beta hydrolase n=1 Tax=Streptomyces cadmiisoli TaxID=2184053 RepID=UPI003D71226C